MKRSLHFATDFYIMLWKFAIPILILPLEHLANKVHSYKACNFNCRTVLLPSLGVSMCFKWFVALHAKVTMINQKRNIGLE